MEAVTTIRAKETDELKRTITEKDDSIKELEGLVEAADEEAAKTEIKLADQTRIIESLSAKLHEKDGSSETKEPIKGKNYEITEFLRYRQDLLKQRIFTIDDELRRLSEQDEEIAVWLDQAYDQKERVVGSELADAEAQEKFNMPGAAREAQRLRIAKQKLEIIISDIQNGEAYKQLRDRIAAVETERRDLIRQKDAVQLLEADIQVEAKSKPPSSKFDISLPDLGALVYRLTTIDGVEEEIIDDYKSKKVGTAETSSEERIQIEGLNFPVSFTETELVRVHDIEEEIKKFFGKSEEEVRTQLVFIPEDDYRKNHYDKLVESLTSDPEYLQKIHMAIVILGTMRDEEGKFVARVANKINYTLKAREVRLAKDFTEAARMTSNIYQQLDILGSINEAWRLLGKKNVGSKWGKANELTIFGQIASQIWTKELLDKRFLTREQLNALYDRSQIISKRTETEEKDSDGESESDSALTISKPRIRISNTSDGKKSGGLKKK
jgi:hypothetical protein